MERESRSQTYVRYSFVGHKRHVKALENPSFQIIGEVNA